MRRAMVFAVALGALIAVPTAAAGSFSGVTVAKDVKRKSLIVASGHSIRTVRAGAGYARIRVGQRVVVRASKLADGTYRAGSVRRAGRAARVRFGAVVVKNERAQRRLILSAGGSVFAVRAGAGGRATAGASGGGLTAGDRVEVVAKLTAAATWSGSATETGRAKLVELEGIFLEKKGDGFDLAVVARGLVHIDVPEGAVLPNFEAGDQVRMVVLIGRDGSFTFIRGAEEGEKPKKPEHPKEGSEVQGVLAEKDPYSVTVRSEGDKRIQCAVPSGMDLSIFRVGERVKIRCVSRENRDVLVKIQSNYGWVKADGSGELSVYGALTKGNGTASVRREDGMSMSCLVPSGIDLSVFRNGEAVKLYCRLGADGFVFGAMYSENASLDSDGVLRLHASGLLQQRNGADPIAVRRQDGSLFACNAPADFQLSYFTVGERVTMTCRVDAGANTLLSLASERYSVGADGSVEVYIYGSVSATTETSVSVTAADSTVVSCAVPAGTDLSKFPVGTSVKMHCHRIAGEFRLEYLKSEHAMLEIGR
jgi:hypothetical protein